MARPDFRVCLYVMMPLSVVVYPTMEEGEGVTFEEILNEAVAMLKRQGRESYRALKRQFDLDDGYLDDLKGEILYTQFDVDEDGDRGLVWTGEQLLKATSCRKASFSLPQLDAMGSYVARKTNPLNGKGRSWFG